MAHVTWTSSSRLKIISPSLSSHKITFDNNCSICSMAKQTRLPFPSSSISTHAPFELLHCDVLGPHKVPTHTGARFFLTIVDDFTRCTWVFLMQHKSETHKLLQTFITFAQTQFHALIKIIRVDNGSEFFPIKSFLQSQGIECQNTCIYTPQQNGVVERKHRHILVVARALLFQSHLPITFWGECVLTAVYLIKRISSPLLSSKSPFEMLYNRPPSLNHLKVFGCLCYATNVHPLKKFEPRAKSYIFVGYPTNQKGYKLYDVDTQSFSVSCDVRFCETIFPFASPSPDPINTTPPPFFPDIPDILPSTTPNPTNTTLESTTSSPAPPPRVPPEVPSPLSPPLTLPPPRQSLRTKQTPTWHKDYILSAHVKRPSPTSSSAPGTRYPLSSFLSYSRLSPSQCTFLANITSHIEPKSYDEAIHDPHWQQAMNT